MQLKDLKPEEAQRLSALLDEAMDLAPEQRDAWLTDLVQREPLLCGLVTDVLASMDVAGREHLIETSDLIDRRFAQATHAEPSFEGRAFGPYRVLRLLGQGGMGSVWLAERADGLFSRQVALKLVHQSLMGGATLGERFARERAILAGLDHPRIARLLDAGVAEDGQPYLAIEYVEGTPLTDYCDAKRLALPARIDLVVQVLSAVQHAHRNLVVHRDLKPSNILVTPEGQVRLLDFGIAKLMTEGTAIETELTQVGGRALTPEYASPEQIAGDPVTTASDVYSLGVLLYELLCGNRPYQLKRDSRGALEEAILTVDAGKPSQSAITDDIAHARSITAKKLRQGLGGDLDTIVLKALKKNPAERYATADAFMQDLQRYLAGEPVTARPDSAVYRARKFVWRNKFAAASSMAVFVALAVGLGVALWQASEARAQAERAEQVKAFTLSIFNNADPDAGGKRATTTVDMLLQARTRIDRELGDKPKIATELMTSVGNSLLGLGETEAAIPIFEEAIKRAAAQLPADDLQALKAQLSYGEALFTAGRLTDAEVPLEHALAGMRRIDDTKGLIAALRWLSHLRREQRHNEVALALAREAAQLAQARLSREDRDIALQAQLDMLGAMQIARQPGLLAPSQRAYELAQLLYGNQLVRPLLVAREFYGTALVAEGDARRGVNLLQEVFAASKDLFGPTHPMVAYFGGRLGVAQQRTGDVNDAIETFRASRAIWDTIHGDALASDRAWGRFYLGKALTAAQHYDQGVTELSEATDIFVRAAGPEYPVTRTARSAYALALARTGALDQAEAEFEKLLAVTPRDPYDAAALKLRLGIARQLQGQFDESEHLLRQAADAFGGPIFDREEQANALAALGATLVEAGRDDSALVEIQHALAIYRELQPRLSPAAADALVAAGRALLALGHADDATVSIAEAVRFWSDFGAGTRSAGLAFLWHARALAAVGQPAAAAEALARGKQVLAASPFASDKALLASLQRELSMKAAHSTLGLAK